MRRILIGATAFALASCTTTDRWQPVPAGQPLNAETLQGLKGPRGNTLFWPSAERDRNFLNMETVFPGRLVRAPGPVRALPSGAPLNVPASVIDAYFAKWNVSGMMVLHNGRIAYERYALGLTRQGRWTSFSVAKSFSSTLVGAAIKDGYIKSLSDPVTRYIPDLAGSGYDGVTVQQLLTMTSGVKWNEDYTDPNSDVARMLMQPVTPGQDVTTAFMRTLPSEAAPGTKWVYKTGETNLIGVLVSRATGKPLSNYLSEKVFRPAGFERDGFWMVDQNGHEIAGCCLSLSLRDYARMGQFVLDGGRGAVPAGWFADATRAHAPVGRPGFGYGYQWWTYPGGLYGAQGIFGQSITVDPRKRAVVVLLGNWPKATAREQSEARAELMARVLGALP